MDYCSRHDISLYFSMTLLDRELTSFWAKYPAIRRVMISHPEVEWIWWMDSDAIFTGGERGVCCKGGGCPLYGE